jgi:hypothetical protein
MYRNIPQKLEHSKNKYPAVSVLELLCLVCMHSNYGE